MALKDIQKDSPVIQIPIDKVGIKQLCYPITILDRENQTQHTCAYISMSVSIPHHFKGTHMSRFVEVLNRHRGEITMRTIPEILKEIKSELEAETAHIEVKFPYFMEKKAPVSGQTGLMDYESVFTGESNGNKDDFVLSVRIPVTAKDGIVAGVLPIIVFVLSGVLSTDIKSIIVFWRIKNPLPGSRVFTELGPKDVRIDMDRIEQIVGTIPAEPKDQNSLWFKYYKKYQDRLTVKSAHKHFLLARDMSVMTLVMLALLPCTIFIISKNWQGALIYLGILFGQHILLSIVTQNHGKRFACNVLAEMCTSD